MVAASTGKAAKSTESGCLIFFALLCNVKGKPNNGGIPSLNGLQET
jgi:hypothetical protein